MIVTVGENAEYVNLGDWIRYFTYGVMENGELTLKSFTGQDHCIIRNS